MAKQETLTVRLRIVYEGTPPNTWDGGAKDFGLQDKANALHLCKTERSGHIVFEIAMEVKPERTARPAFVGRYARWCGGRRKGRSLGE
jgi:hypothetical protein